MTVIEIRRAAMNLLARREHSRREIIRKLAARTDSQDLLGVALDQLELESYLSDDRFAASYTRSRRNKGFGPVRIAGELREKGVSEELIASYVYCPEINWHVEALIVKRKKFGTGVEDDVAEKAKQSRFLMQRGFKSEYCQYALSTPEGVVEAEPT